jgi:hypothetical protein
VRNYLVTGEFIPFTTEGGKILFQGVFLAGDDVQMSELRKNAEFAALEAASPAGSPVEDYRYWRRLAAEQMKADPVGQVRLCVRKAIRFWTYLPAHEWRPSLKTGLAAAVVLPLALVGVVRGWRHPLVRLSALWVGGLWAFHALVHAELRYNFPVLPMAFLLSLLAFNRPTLGKPENQT